MYITVLKRDNNHKSVWKMLFRSEYFTDRVLIMPHIRENYGYKLGDEFLVLYDGEAAHRVHIVDGGIMPQWDEQI